MKHERPCKDLDVHLGIYKGGGVCTKSDGLMAYSSQVFTRLRLAALCLKWNPSGNAFAIGSSDRLICMCHKDKVRLFTDWI